MHDILKISKHWAIDPDALKHLSRLKDFESFSIRSDKRLNNTRTVLIRDGTAIIPIHGPITAKSDLFTLFFGGTSLSDLAKDLQTALEDNQVKSILFDIDSPGGVAIGPYEFAEMIFKSRSQKPIWSYIGRNGSSAAYWLASATERIIVNPSALVGSIGVVTTIPVQEQPDLDGYKNIEIVSTNASLKRPDPRTETGLKEIKRELDDIEESFISSIAKYRNLTPETIKNDFGQGGVVIGHQAVLKNMADGLGSFEEVITELNQKFSNNKNNQIIMSKEQKEIVADQISKKEITTSYIKAEFPDIAKELATEASKLAFSDGAKAERERILSIEAAALPGHEDLIEEAKKDGSITAEKLALKIVAAEKQKAGTYLSNLQKSEAELPKITPNFAKEPSSTDKIDPNLPLETKAKLAWEKDQKLRTEFGNDYEAYHAYMKADSENQIKILSK